MASQDIDGGSSRDMQMNVWRVLASQLRGALLLVSVLLACMNLANLRSAYVMLLWVVPLLVFVVIAVVLGRILPVGTFATFLCYTLFTGLMTLPVLYWCQIARTVLMIFLPVMGRSGMVLRPDVFIGLLFGLLTAFISLPALALLRAPPRGTTRKFVQPVCICLMTCTAMSVVYGVFGIGAQGPYSVERPKRLFVQQILRVFHDATGKETTRESHLWVNAHDILALGPLVSFEGHEKQGPPKEWREIEAYACNRTSPTACSLPWFFPLADVILHGWLLPSAPPPVTEGHELKVTFARQVGSHEASRIISHEPGMPHIGQRRLDIQVTGPNIVGVVIRDRSKRIIDWSLGQSGSDGGSWAEAPSPEAIKGMRVGRRGKKVAHSHIDGSYFMYFVGGGANSHIPRTWDFWLLLQGDELIEMEVYGHYFDFGSPDVPDNSGCGRSKEQSEMQEHLPAWISPICWTNHFHQYQV